VARGCAAACFAGDDAGDLAAFEALDRLALEGTRTVRLAVADEETPPALLAAADFVARGPSEALALFGALAARTGRPRPQ
jgi:trehalose 6-phosphate phosphatase